MTTKAKTNGHNRIAGALDALQVTNGGAEDIGATVPYTATIRVVGTAPLLFHQWNCDAVEEKAKAAKGSKSKKEDNIESYLYRTDAGVLGVPGTNFHACLIEAGRFQQDPRSPRKSARDLVKAAVAPLDIVAPFAKASDQYDYLDRRRAVVQRNGVTRVRPAMLAGWDVTFRLLVLLPEYMTLQQLTKLANDAGRMVGLCDFRPTFGRFTVAGVEIDATE